MLKSKLVFLVVPAPPKALGLGLRLLKLPIGLATPLIFPLPSPPTLVLAGATTLILSSSREPCEDASIEAALSSTDGTL